VITTLNNINNTNLLPSKNNPRYVIMKYINIVTRYVMYNYNIVSKKDILILL
jgi:hypothetical protein